MSFLYYYFSGGFTIQLATLVPGELGNFGQEIPVARTYRHPSYLGNVLYGNDVALLQLAYAPRIDNYTRPVCMGNRESFQKVLDQGTQAECYITGNGYQENYVLNGEYYFSDCI